MFNVASSTKSFASTTKHIAGNLHPIHHLHQFGQYFIVTPLGLFMAWLTIHTHLAYGVLFAGAYLEALVGPSFFIPGEIFLLGGSILAGSGVLDIWLVLVALYGGAILGDSSSYFIGRRIGKSIFHERKKFLNIKNYQRIEALFEKYGTKALFFARLIGPFNKVAPAIAGIFEIPFKKFLMYNIPGVIVGCGEFIIAGYFFGNQYALILYIIERYILALILALGSFFLIRWYIKKRRREAMPPADSDAV
jgi:membrane-associated protein